jgi:hypothetical protein
MALTSPGVQVSVIDESFYTPAEPGTRPLFIVASTEGKTNGSGTGTAQGTLAANAGKVYLITSQRDLVDTFGDPTFKVDSNNNPIHAGELNEYGLQAAYSYLGVSNSTFVVRADINLDKLVASADAPGGAPVDGTFWLDTASTNYGIFEWNGAVASPAGGQSFTNKVPTIISVDGGVPLASAGAPGTYALVYDGTTPISTTGHEITLYYKSAYEDDGQPGTATWVKVGSNEWATAHTMLSATPSTTNTAFTSGDDIVFDVDGTTTGINVVGTTVSALASAITASSIGLGARVVNGRLEIYAENNDINRFRILANDGITPGGITTSTDLLEVAGLTSSSTVYYYAPRLQISKHTQVPEWKLRNTAPRPTGSVWIKTTEPNLGARWRVKVYNDTTQLWDAAEAPLYASNQAALAGLDLTGGGINLAFNSVYVQHNFDEATKPIASFRVMRRARTGATTMRTGVISSSTFSPAGLYTFVVGVSRTGETGIYGVGSAASKTISFTSTAATTDAQLLASAINSSGLVGLSASITADNRVLFSLANGGEIRFKDTAGDLSLADNGSVYAIQDPSTTFTHVASNWAPTTFSGAQQTYYISGTAPETLVADGELWYSSVVDEVDLLIHDGNTWVGYGNGPVDVVGTNVQRAIVGASTPTTFEDGDAFPVDLATINGQIWIDTSDLENYPTVKRWNGDLLKWEILDKSDQTTENGVLFADARWATSGDAVEAGNINELFDNNFLDFDAPDPALYPRGMILWNLRRSGFNVKKFVRNYIDVTADNIRMSGDPAMTAYYPHRWVTESGNQADGSGSFGRHAQRKVIVQSLQALVNSNEDIRDTEVRGFNLMACPGYPELIGEMVNLNYDRGLTAFVVGDTPARLTPDATTINDWGNNVALSLQDDDNGLVSFDEYLGVFYPWGFTSDNAGNDVAVPPSHMICRMIALSDQVSYPWFAPAGTRRGGITNASAVGYVTSEGEFVSIALNEGQRDTLYNVKVNPITFFTGAGLVNFGQKTRARNASALDRINVARLVIYLRSQLNKLAKPYIFEPNDKITRDEIKQQVESLLLELVGQRALYDFLVVCDESNNTPNRIDRNELYVDIAIEPVKAVEFIYIPVRLKNTGEIAGL